MKNKLEKLLPILQSSLPSFDRMLPYLEQVQVNRCHSNFGKLFHLFEERMAAMLNVQPENVVMLCNGTLALTAGLLAMHIPNGKYCLMPSWTFSATPSSAMLAGLTPFFLDVDVESQTLTPEKVMAFLQAGKIDINDIGAVLPVSPFGAPLSRQAWDNFTRETSIPVLIDAAASFDAVHHVSSMQVGATPMMVSLHATKIFGIGEGGMVVSTNADLIKRIKGISNFGFDSSRVSSYLGTNAKMSEYQAAIGLGVLDSWQEIRQARLAVTQNYINLFNQLGLDTWLSSEWLTSTCNLLLPNFAEQARDYLVSHNVESRIWWGKGCHTYPAYQHLPREEALPNTAYLSNCMLGLPFSIDTSAATIDLIGTILEEFLAATQKEKRRAKA